MLEEELEKELEKNVRQKRWTQLLENTVTALHTEENSVAQMKYPLKKTEQVKIEKSGLKFG